MEKYDEICNLLDKLTLEVFELLEQDIQTKIYIETTFNEGQLLMAKARYIQGQNSVSESQLPTENSPEFKSLVNTHRDYDELNIPKCDLINNPVDKENGYVEPLNWFGVLVPQSLCQAKEKFMKAIELTIDSSNIRNKLSYLYFNISKLNNSKKELLKA